MLKLKTFLFNETDGDSSAGGGQPAQFFGGAATSNPPAASTDPGTEVGTEQTVAFDLSKVLDGSGGFVENWREASPEFAGISDGMAAKMKNLPGFIKSAAEAQKMIRAKLAMPNGEATPEAVAQFRKVNGIVDSIDEYNVTAPEEIPEGVIFDEAMLAKTKESFNKHNLPEHVAQGILQDALAMQGELAQQQAQEIQDQQQQDIVDLRNDWGNNFDGKLQAAEKTYNDLCDKIGIDANATGLVGNVAFIKLMDQVASMTGESKQPVGMQNQQATVTAANVEEANRIRNDQSHPDHAAYWDANSPMHETVRNKVRTYEKG